MKIILEKYTPEWKQTFTRIKNELDQTIGFVHPIVKHIGSTSIEGLSAKPIIDILVGLNSEEDLDKITAPLMARDYVYYEKYNAVMPYRRFFVMHKIAPSLLSIPLLIRAEDTTPNESLEHSYRIAHIHALPFGSQHWIRHIAFRDYLRTHPDVREEYQQLKEELSKKEWRDGNEYNEWKDDFIKREEKNALQWFSENR